MALNEIQGTPAISSTSSGRCRASPSPAPTLPELGCRSLEAGTLTSRGEALASIGAPAMNSVPQLLELLAQVDVANDPRGMQQRYLSFALFERNGMLSRSLEGVDRSTLYVAVRAGLAPITSLLLQVDASVGSFQTNQHFIASKRPWSERRIVACGFDSATIRGFIGDETFGFHPGSQLGLELLGRLGG